jgi:uncharacterized protein
VNIRLTQLAEGPLRVDLAWPGEAFGRLGEESDPVTVVGTVTGWAELSLSGDPASPEAVLVRGRVAFRLRRACGRCLEELEEAKEVELDLVLAPSLGQFEAERRLDAADLNLDLLPGEELDLKELIRQQMDLACEMVGLCRPDCRGLCPLCGQNLNTGPCQCRAAEPDPRLAKLAQWRTGATDKQG